MMCTAVIVGSTWCYSVGELRERLPGIDVLKNSVYLEMPRDSSCLCGVDIDATLTAAGVAFSKDDCGDYHVDQKGHS